MMTNKNKTLNENGRAWNAISLRQLEAFRSVIAAGSVTGAAKHLGVTQPGISRLLSQLEEQMGLRLFDRKHGRLTATPEALMLVDDVNRTFEGLDKLRQTASTIHLSGTGPLRIGATPILYRSILKPALGMFTKDRPDTTFSLEVGTSEAVIEWVATGQLEMGMTYFPIQQPGIDTEVLLKTDAVCVMPKGHPLTAKSVIRPADLSGVPFIGMTRRISSRHRIEEVFRKAGRPLNMRAEVNLVDAARDLVREEIGVTILSPIAVVGKDGEGLEIRPFRPRQPRNYGIITAVARSLSGTATDFIEVLRQYVREAIDRGDLPQSKGPK